MIANAHIDPVWLWPTSEGRAEVLSTYRTAIALIKEYRGYVFTSGGAVTFEWVEHDDPALFAAIRQAVREGRWALVNGWWLQPDCNLPSGESFARHALYGQRYLQSRFGQRARVGYNVDSFGHAGTLPQLLKLAGLDYYVFFRPGPHEKPLPTGPFWWEAPDGTRVLACRPPLHYGTPGEVNIADRVCFAAREVDRDLPVALCFYGVGNHGGGPTRRNVEDLVRLAATSTMLQPVFSSPEAYFGEVSAQAHDWPVVRDELQHHSRGCYSVLSRVKRENRQAEHALAQAERFSALATVAAGTPNAQVQLREAWQGVLFGQFHDILAGTSIREAYDDVWAQLAQSRRTAASMQTTALQALEARLDVPDRAGARSIVVWNPLPWERSDVVQLPLRMGGWRHDFAGARFPGQPLVTDRAGQPIPCRMTHVSLDHNTYVLHVEAWVAVQGLGSRLLYVQIPEVAPQQNKSAPRYATEIRNDKLRLRVDADTGWISSLHDVARGAELLTGPVVPLVIADDSDTWSHDVEAFREVCGRFVAQGPVQLTRDDTLCQALRVRAAWGGSSIVQDIALYAGAPFVDLSLTVDWHERFKMLKLATPINVRAPRVTASAPYGCIARLADGLEEPCQGWIDVSGGRGGEPQGLCVINDSKYGYDALQGELRLSILRSPIYAFHRPRKVVEGVDYTFIDQGTQVVHMRLFPHAGGWQECNPARGDAELHEPLFARPVTPHAGAWDDVSLLRVAPDNVHLECVKLGEESGTLIARGYETQGREAYMQIVSPLLGAHWAHSVRPHEVWTLALPLGGGEPQPLNLMEEPLHA